MNALLDTSANSTSISRKIGQLLLHDGIKENYTLEVSGGDIKKYQAKICHVKLGDRKGKRWKDIALRIFPHPCGSLHAPDWSANKRWFPHLEKYCFYPPVNEGVVDHIIGTDQADLMIHWSIDPSNIINCFDSLLFSSHAVQCMINDKW